LLPPESIVFAFITPQSALYGISLLTTLSISEKSRRHENAYLVTVSDPDDLTLPTILGDDTSMEADGNHFPRELSLWFDAPLPSPVPTPKELEMGQRQCGGGDSAIPPGL
jgi:hypothetical protein